MGKRLLFALLILSLTWACGDLPVSPSPTNGTTTALANREAVLREWSPYIGIHVTGEAFDAYKEVVPALIQRGVLKGIRIELTQTERRDFVMEMLMSFNLEVLMLVSNCIIIDTNIEQRMDRIISLYPEISHFQIGNEVTSIARDCKKLTIEEYMPIFKRVYNHVTANYPHIILITQPAGGAGGDGSAEIEKMEKLGMKDMSPEKVRLSFHLYSESNSGTYAGALSGVMKKFRIWITESGSGNAERQIEFVTRTYPMIKNRTRPERIYWYVMWGGDGPPDFGFGLLIKPAAYPNYVKRPLLKILLGEE